MKKVLFLTHRFPYPANKGDKIRALNILEHLSATHEVFLGCVDGDSEGLPATKWATQRGYKVYCGSAGRAQRLPGTAWSLIKGEPLSVGYFRHSGLLKWVQGIQRSERPDLTYVFSSAMAQYAIESRAANSRLIMDFVDVDLIKWRQYAATRRPPSSWVYALEARRLLSYDRKIASMADASLFVSPAELELFRSAAPETAAKLHVVPNGVDTVYFAPGDRAASSPISNIVFVGVMDYWPNVEAVQWFATAVLPLIVAQCPEARFQIVGSTPSAAVRQLSALPGIEVTGSVPDVRPYLDGAGAVVAPLRIARGIQNKVLEGMAMARPVVTTPEALEGIPARSGIHVFVASDPQEFADAVIRCLRAPETDQMAHRAREFVVSQFSWATQLRALDAIISA